MYHVPDQNEEVYSDEISQSTNYVVRRYDEKLDDAIRLDEARQAVLDSGYPEYWTPVDDWWLD
ncbi:MAG: hypothetical protein NT159_02600 [Proteobacteria bacterium]|nr:hypothetical protein [Pseudomonadota bacterium]